MEQPNIIHVLHVIGAKKAGGAETFFMRLVEAQHKDPRFKVTCIVRKGSWVEKGLRDLGIPTMSAPFGTVLDFKTKSIIRNAVEAMNIDVVQGWMNRACTNIPALNVPVIGRMGGYYKLKNYTNCHVVAGNTRMICDYLADKGLEADEISYLPNFTEEDHATLEDRTSIRNGLNIPADAPVALMAARLHQVKGIDIAIRALEKLKETHLVVLGEGGEKENLHSLAKTLNVRDRVHFAGWQRHVSAYSAACDMWWILSRHEPLGNSVLDGWMHQKPIVATKSDGPNVLIEHGKTGMLIDIDDVDALVEHTQNIINNGAENMVKNGYAYVMENYSKTAVLNVYYETYEDMIANKGFLKHTKYKVA